MRAAGSTASCGAVPAARAIPASRSSISPWKTNYDELDNLLGISRQLKPADLEGKDSNEILELATQAAERRYEEKEAQFEQLGAEMRGVERWMTLKLIDDKWVEHLNAMDYLREGIHLRGYAQIDPLVAYKKEAYEMFQALLNSIQDDRVSWMFHLEIRAE